MKAVTRLFDETVGQNREAFWFRSLLIWDDTIYIPNSWYVRHTYWLCLLLLLLSITTHIHPMPEATLQTKSSINVRNILLVAVTLSWRSKYDIYTLNAQITV
jgi:hypothetical protein